MEFLDNHAYAFGGGAYFERVGTTILNGITMRRNIATQSGGIYLVN